MSINPYQINFLYHLFKGFPMCFCWIPQSFQWILILHILPTKNSKFLKISDVYFTFLLGPLLRHVNLIGMLRFLHAVANFPRPPPKKKKPTQPMGDLCIPPGKDRWRSPLPWTSWFIMAPKTKQATFWEWQIAIYYHYAVPSKSLEKGGKSSYCTQTNERNWSSICDHLWSSKVPMWCFSSISGNVFNFFF